jgi:hypothetical protein
MGPYRAKDGLYTPPPVFGRADQGFGAGIGRQIKLRLAKAKYAVWQGRANGPGSTRPCFADQINVDETLVGGSLNLSCINPVQSSASVADARTQMVRELLYREQRGRELAPCVIAKERPANQARMTTWTRQLRKVARRTHIADRTMNTHCFLFGHLSTHDQVSVPNARRTNFSRSGSGL